MIKWPCVWRVCGKNWNWPERKLVLTEAGNELIPAKKRRFWAFENRPLFGHWWLWDFADVPQASENTWRGITFRKSSNRNFLLGKYYRPSNRSEVLLTKCNFSNKNRQILTLYICFRIYFSHLFPLRKFKDHILVPTEVSAEFGLSLVYYHLFDILSFLTLSLANGFFYSQNNILDFVRKGKYVKAFVKLWIKTKWSATQTLCWEKLKTFHLE